MAFVMASGPASRAIDSLARVTDGFFRDPGTGNVVLVESPNTQMKALGMALGTSRVLRAAHVVESGRRHVDRSVRGRSGARQLPVCVLSVRARESGTESEPPGARS